MDRRSFVKSMAILCAAGSAGAREVWAAETDINAARIPRWRGFNLQGKFAMPGRPYDGRAFEEFDFATMVEWGFDFARLPLSYWVWGNRDDWSVIREEPLQEIDRAVDLGRQHGIHINLNFHRIPGYCINGRELEAADLFSGTKAQRDEALAAAVFHWKAFAKRYKGIPNRRISFDLINEPPKMRSYEGYLEERYVEIVKALVAAIREEDPNRLIFADGINIGQAPVLGIVEGDQPLHRQLGPQGRIRNHESSHLAAQGRSGTDLGSRSAEARVHRPLPSSDRERCADSRRRVGLFQQNTSRGNAGLDGRLPLTLERGGLGKFHVEFARPLRSPRQRTAGRAI